MKFFALAAAFSGFLTVANAVESRSPCDPISKYSTEWFLANTKPEYRFKSFDSTALFYTQGLSERARKFARQARNKITIWDVWPCENYFIKSTRQNPLACIMEDAKEEMAYFENMSRAFAMMAANVASVMHRDIENPPMSTIWGRIELPVLQAASNPWGTVNYITAIDAEDVHRRKIEWIRHYSGMLYDNAEAVIQKILHAREEEGVENLEKREEDACPLMSIRPEHPLW
ncbi:hypothetical protein G7Y89_g12748 [Cudoniella acicularis]|uniref:Uncharacterized protein n=1 Tax=Cudoniella acicularis TaxID=354080 RepID=A0A8H4VWQ5_9HELO|nr:hypothetical protein G7Y89_g12748 [Cudoniella acicularis]